MSYTARPLVLLAFLGGCLSPSDAPPPVIESAVLVESGPLVRTLEVTLQEPTPLVIEYWAERGPRLRVASPPGTSHTLRLTRLWAGRTYRYRVLGTSHEGSFHTEALPADLARIGFVPTGTPTVPLVMLHLYQPDGFKGYAIVDATGQVVWFWRTVDFPFGMARRDNGNFVFMDKGRGLLEVSPARDVVHELPQDTVDREMHHDVIVTPENSLLFLAFDTRHVDGARVKGEAIWEWSPDAGRSVKRWSSWDHLSPTADRGARFGVEWMHANSLAIGPRRNVLVSVHYFNQIISIRADWRAIEWRLGGVNATVPLSGNHQFSGQHTAREISPGRVVLFDNRLEQGGPSRAVEFALLEGGASTVWEWRSALGNFASATSSARRLPNGHTLVGFGMSPGLVGSTGPTEVYQVAPDGAVRWHLAVSNVWVMFRAEPLWSVGEERERP